MRKMKGIRSKINKKVLTLGGIALILVGAVVANLWLNNRLNEPKDPAADGSDAVEASARASFFESFRADRDTTRAKEIEYIDTIIAQGADQETMADAQQQKLAIVDNMEKELTVESLLRAKGFQDVAVTMHTGSVNVILSAEALSEEQVAQVLEIVIRETGEAAENIKVSTAQ